MSNKGTVKSVCKKILHTVSYHIYLLHLYTSKGEALFKAAILGVSWGGGVYLQKTVAAYYFFSISIIMEYAIQLIKAKEFFPKLLPLILVVSNIIVFIFSSSKLANHESSPGTFQYYIELITIIIVGADALITLIIEPPEECKIEANIRTSGNVHNKPNVNGEKK